MAIKEGLPLKDPRQVLESFRTDVQSRNVHSSLLRQFDLEYPNSKGNRRKRRRIKPQNGQTAAVLSLCLMTGMTFGVGSAFADNEVVPEPPPLDQAPVKAKLKIEENRDLGADLERPLQDFPPKEQEKKDFEKPQAPKAKADPRTEKKDIAPDTDIPSEDSTFKQPAKPNHHSNTQDSPIMNDSHEKQAIKETVPKEKAPEEPVSMVDSSRKAIPNGSQHALEKKGSSDSTPLDAKGAEKGAGGTQKMITAGGQPKSSNDSRASGEVPQTVQGGELPKTASNDLNGVVIGSSLAVLGSLYALRRKRADET